MRLIKQRRHIAAYFVREAKFRPSEAAVTVSEYTEAKVRMLYNAVIKLEGQQQAVRKAANVLAFRRNDGNS